MAYSTAERERETLYVSCTSQLNRCESKCPIFPKQIFILIGLGHIDRAFVVEELLNFLLESRTKQSADDRSIDMQSKSIAILQVLERNNSPL